MYVKYGVTKPVTQFFFAINFAPLMTHPCQRVNLLFSIFLEKEKTTFATFLENENMIRHLQCIKAAAFLLICVKYKSYITNITRGKYIALLINSF